MSCVNTQCSGFRNLKCLNVPMFKSQTCQLPQHHNVQVSDISIVAMSQCSSLRHLKCGNITMFKSQIGGLALNQQKWLEMGLEWSPGPENRSPSFPRPSSRLWDRSRGPKSSKYSPNSHSAPGGRYLNNEAWGNRPDFATSASREFARTSTTGL